MSPLEEKLRAVVAAAGGSWSKEDLELGTRTGLDVAQLLVRQAAGEDVDKELAMAKASAQNVAAGSAVAAGRAISDAIIGVVTKGLAALATA